MFPTVTFPPTQTFPPQTFPPTGPLTFPPTAGGGGPTFPPTVTFPPPTFHTFPPPPMLIHQGPTVQTFPPPVVGTIPPPQLVFQMVHPIIQVPQIFAFPGPQLQPMMVAPGPGPAAFAQGGQVGAFTLVPNLVVAPQIHPLFTPPQVVVAPHLVFTPPVVAPQFFPQVVVAPQLHFPFFG